jgi:hypothetical protein
MYTLHKLHDIGEKVVFVFRLHILFSSLPLPSCACAKAEFLHFLQTVILPASLAYDTKKNFGL